MLRTIRKKLRSLIPLALYPYILAPRHRRYRRNAIRELEAEDRKYLEANPGTVAPGAELRFNVVGPCSIAWFLDAGRRTADDIHAACAKAGYELQGAFRALDFGCGCGRLLIEAVRRWPQARWVGSDVDPKGVRWCAENLPGVTSIVNEHAPPLPFEDGEFDLVWCGSVFSHLDEARQDAWLAELLRAIKPGGHLLASVHGPSSFEGLKLPERVIERIRKDGFLFLRTGFDEGVHPDWYQTAYHTPEYIEKHWGAYGRIAAYIPQGLNGYQDIVVVKKAG